ncbi:MAG TPA: DUF58 domain-containing protein, partial [Bacillota bacterium]|nr:DUF58 domain-containing protein [Bacillota bacterium]
IVSYEFRIINDSIIPYPFVDAQLSIPSEDGVKCVDRIVSMSLIPTGCYIFENKMRFRYRGSYRVGVANIYVQDFFRIFRLRLTVDIYNDIYILPRRIPLERSTYNAPSDMPTDSNVIVRGNESSERSNIREYRTGDSLKHIHWKLSSKAEDFLVRDYDTGSSKQTLVFCDLSARFPTEPPERTEEKAPARNKKPDNQAANGDSEVQKKAQGANGADGPAAGDATAGTQEPDIGTATVEDETRDMARGHHVKKKTRAARRRKGAEAGESQNNGIQVDINELADDAYYDDMNEYCADGVVELTVAVVLRELRDNNVCTLFWFDRRSETGVYSFTLRGIEDFNAIYRLFATAPLCSAEETVARLSRMVKDTQDTKQLFITAAIDPDSVRELCSLPNISDGAAWGASAVILYNPEERFAHISERKLYIESCRSQLMSRGLRLVEGRLDKKLRLE